MRLPWQLALRVLCFFVFLSTHSGHAADQPAAKQTKALPGIVFVGAPIFDEKTDGGEGVYQGSYHWRDGYIYPRSATYHLDERTMGPPRPGRNLYALIPARPDGKLTRLTHLKSGAVYKPEPSYDGAKVLFAMRRDGEDWFHLCEVNVDGSGSRQLTDGPFNDFGAVYLPDGRIVFCSDRTGYLEEYHEERAETLFVMNGDGTGIQQITFMPGTYFEPSMMRDGRILFSFWDAFHIDVPPFDKHETYLMTVNPDGTEERHLFGAGQYRFFNRERHSGVGLTQAHEMPDGRILVQSEMGPSLIDLRAGLSVREALAPVFPGTTSVQLGGTTHRVHLSPLGTRSTPHPLQDGRFLLSATLPGARDSAIYVCDPETRREELVLNIPDYAEFDAVPVLVERPKPALLPAKITPKSRAATRFLVIAGRNADNPQRAETLKRARYFRVIEAEYTGVTTSSHTNLETRILGTVPILPDGSAYFEVPADTPIFLDPIDAAGNRVLMEWSYPNTSVAVGSHYPATQMAYMVGRPGETRACYGCHATQTEAVPNTTVMALKYGPFSVTRSLTNIQYRRNEPEAYRRQARIGEASKYRPWLSSSDPTVRARGCAMLMYIEDGTEHDLPAISRLLSDESPKVRQAALLALMRLAPGEQTYAHIAEALRDSDSKQEPTVEDSQSRLSFELALEGMNQAHGVQPEFALISGPSQSAETKAKVLAELHKPLPDVQALRAAGKMKDPQAIPLLAPWLKRHEWEYHAAEAAVALGRIGTPEAVRILWQAVRSEVPNRKVHLNRYLQHGPRPEEYALLKGLVLASAKAEVEDVPLLIALLPGTFQEKPRFEDRMRAESQRVLMPRILLERSGYRQRVVAILLAALQGEQKNDDPLYAAVLRGINLERPFSEHGRRFDPVKRLGGEEALWLLGCLLETETDLGTLVTRDRLEELVVPFLRSKNHRERIDAAVLLGLTGFGAKTARALAVLVAEPYAFAEICSIGKGMPDENFRDKAYLVQALARHIGDVDGLKPFADPKKVTRDIRYGLTHGLALRGKADGIPLLIAMAISDPITLVRREARNALADIQDSSRIAGRPVPDVRLPDERPLEALYPPRDLKWADTSFVEFERNPPRPTDSKAARGNRLEQYLNPANFRNLNNAQATGAQRMMIAHAGEMKQFFEDEADTTGNNRRRSLVRLLDSPYPFAHYLAANTIAESADITSNSILQRKLEEYSKAQDMVGFWWCCEALAQLRATAAAPALAHFAVSADPPGTFGPEGMAAGYIAAKALCQIVADPKQADVRRLLASENVWLRAGALRGLAEANVERVDELLRQAAEEENPAVVRYEARVQLRHRQQHP
jgi:HEAT repeat protein